MTNIRGVFTWKQSKRLVTVGFLLSCLIICIIYNVSDLQFNYQTDVLIAEYTNFSPSSKSIFFHETSSRGGLDSREACTVEAAARAHPAWEVHVLFVAPLAEQPFCNENLEALSKFGNIHFTKINMSEYAKGTPVESLITSGKLNRSRWRVSHTSDILRYTTLYKWGGVYLDLDAVVVKPFDSLKRNWAARESDLHVAAGALAFSNDLIGRTVADTAIRDISKNFRGDIWSYNGPGVITRVLKKICNTSKASLMSAKKCKGFEMYGPKLFYPVTWQNAAYYFKPGVLDFPGTYVYHVWNRVTHGTPALENSRYANLAKKYCPTIYMTHPEDFGIKTKINTKK